MRTRGSRVIPSEMGQARDIGRPAPDRGRRGVAIPVVGKGVWFTINGPRRSRSGDRSGKLRNQMRKNRGALATDGVSRLSVSREGSGDRQGADRPALKGRAIIRP